MQLALKFIPKVFSGFEVGALTKHFSPSMSTMANRASLNLDLCMLEQVRARLYDFL